MARQGCRSRTSHLRRRSGCGLRKRGHFASGNVTVLQIAWSPARGGAQALVGQGPDGSGRLARVLRETDRRRVADPKSQGRHKTPRQVSIAALPLLRWTPKARTQARIGRTRIRDPAVLVPEAMEFQLMAKQSSSKSGQHGSQRSSNSQNTSNASRSRSTGSRGAPGRSQSGHSQQASGHRRASSEEEE